MMWWQRQNKLETVHDLSMNVMASISVIWCDDNDKINWKRFTIYQWMWWPQFQSYDVMTTTKKMETVYDLSMNLMASIWIIWCDDNDKLREIERKSKTAQVQITIFLNLMSGSNK